MFDIGSMELFLVAVVALVVVGPRELPALLRTVTRATRFMRSTINELKDGAAQLAREVEDEIDPFADERKREGIKPSMSPEEITEKILGNRGGGAPKSLRPDSDALAKSKADAMEDREAIAAARASAETTGTPETTETAADGVAPDTSKSDAEDHRT